MSCTEWTAEISETSRRGGAPGDALADHLAMCRSCTARWQSEAALDRDLARVRQAASHLRSAPASRARLLEEFEARRAVRSPRIRTWMAIAATIVLAVALALWREPVHTAQAPAAVEQAADEVLADNDFVPVPYAPPLAQGEMVEVVRMDLSPAALAGMGFVTQAGYSGDVTTDLVIGEDGLPRAVRLPESFQIRF